MVTYQGWTIREWAPTRRHFSALVVVVLVFQFLWIAPAALAAPGNDNFADATVLSGASGSISGTTSGATGEVGEPNHAGVSAPLNSVWYQWTAPASGTVEMDTCGSSFDTTLAVYTGPSLGALDQVVANDDGCFVQSSLSFNTLQDNAFWIAVDGFSSATGSFVLNWDSSSPTGGGPGLPFNDDFADAQFISGSAGSVSGTNVGATGEFNEPDIGQIQEPINSVWYQWTAPSSGAVSVDTCESSYDTTLLAFNGTLSSWSSIVAGDNDSCGVTGGGSAIAFFATAGTTYYFQVDGVTFATGTFTLVWSSAITGGTGPANDDFADAQILSGDSGTVEGDNEFATGEAGEPNHAGNSLPLNSVWYRWTAPATGSVTIDVCGGGPTYAIYTGDSLGSLTEIGSKQFGCDDGITFIALEGTTYLIAVDGGGGHIGTFDLTWLTAPANDDFANAEVLSGASGLVQGTTEGATGEAGEPDHAGSSAPHHSVWYQWSVPAAGSVTIEACGDGVQGYAVYVGDAVDSLTEIGAAQAFSFFWLGELACVTDGIVFTASEGTTYWIAVNSNESGDPFRLSWGLTSDPVVDADDDGIPDTSDNCPVIANASQDDNDSDGAGDACDDDDDNDGVSDAVDAFPNDSNESADNDGDGQGDNADQDDDNDGVPDDADAFPLDASESSDNDGDGTGDNADQDDDNDGISDEVEGTGDLDNDGLPNHQDTDADGDGNPDQSEGTGDVDGDGRPNYKDVNDDDGPSGDQDDDGIANAQDNCVTVANPEQRDRDGDGIGNACDPDFAVYQWSGFLGSVEDPDTVNVGKAGRTYPIKWQLRDEVGTFVSSLSAVESLKYTAVTCGEFASDPTDAIETTATGATTLRYDSQSNQYVYNWATPSAAGCYVLFLTLEDGGVHYALFRLTK